MKFTDFLIQNKKGEPSSTLTAFVLGSIVVNLKLILSGVTVGDFTVTAFTGVEYAAAMAALGGVYLLKNPKKDPKSEEKKD